MANWNNFNSVINEAVGGISKASNWVDARRAEVTEVIKGTSVYKAAEAKANEALDYIDGKTGGLVTTVRELKNSVENMGSSANASGTSNFNVDADTITSGVKKAQKSIWKGNSNGSVDINGLLQAINQITGRGGDGEEGL